MYAQITLDGFAKDSQNSARVILGARSVFIGVKQLLGKLFAHTLAFCIAVPFALVVIYLKRRISKRFPSNIDIDSTNYTNIRKSYDISSELLRDLRPIKDFDVSSFPLALRLMLRQIKSLVSKIEINNHKLAKALAKLDKMPSQKSLQLFQQIKEADLWANRPKVYQYRL
jgi:hypothetical protein